MRLIDGGACKAAHVARVIEFDRNRKRELMAAEDAVIAAEHELTRHGNMHDVVIRQRVLIQKLKHLVGVLMK